MAIGNRILMRRDTASNWTSTNPTLVAGEPGLESDTLKFKLGDGSTAWNALAYQGSQTTGQILLSPTAIKTAAYTAQPNDLVVIDISGGSVPIALPTAPADKTRIGFKIVNATPSNTSTITAGGSDVFNIAAGATSLTLAEKFEAITIQYASSTHIWYVQNTDLGANPVGRTTKYTSSDVYLIPAGATLLELVAVGGGGGGGGSGSAAATQAEIGGNGGGAGAAVHTICPVGNNTQITLTIGAGGPGGTGGAAGGNGGTQGSAGGNSTLTGDGTGISFVGYGGSGGSATGASQTGSPNGGGALGGGEFGNLVAFNNSGSILAAPGNGGLGNNVSGAGGVGNGYAGGGGSAGGAANATLGGGAGNAGSSMQGGARATNNSSATANGVNGTSAAGNTGAGGGGGGGGAAGTGSGGNGGTGGSGWVSITVVA